MKTTTMNREEANQVLTKLRADINALVREAKALPLTPENVEHLQAMQDRRIELEIEFARISSKIASI